MTSTTMATRYTTSYVNILYLCSLICGVSAYVSCNTTTISADLADILIEETTPQNASSLAKYTKSSAFNTLSCNIPATLEIVFEKVKEDFGKHYSEEAKAELNLALDELKQLKDQLGTANIFRNFTSPEPDSEMWNSHLKKFETNGAKLNLYEVNWLFGECYLYRRIREIFASKKLLNSLDPFSIMKEEFLNNALPAIRTMFQHLENKGIFNSSLELNKEVIKNETTNLFKFALWGNRLDLSLTRGNTSVSSDMLNEVRRLDDNILVNDLDSVYTILTDRNKSKLIEYIMDNSGMEALTDFILADLFITRYEVSRVNFRLKRIPWFVSDVTKYELNKTIETLRNHSDNLFQKMGNRWKKYIDSGIWTITTDNYWTLGLSYTNMSEVDPVLYNDLSKANLIIFKGDLNYRKLIQDRSWKPSTPFNVALGKFHPAPLVALRTCKVDVISGLKIGQAEELNKKTSNWIISSDFALIQFDSP